MIENLLSIRKPNEYNAFSWIENTVTSDDVVVVGYNYMGFEPIEIRKLHPDKKIILYQFEQISAPGNLWYNPSSKKGIVAKRTKHLLDWYKEADEIWEYDIQNYHLLKRIEPRKDIKLVPVTKFNPYLYQDAHSHKYDIIFYGSVNPKRMSTLKFIASRYKLLIVCQADTDIQRELQMAGATVITPRYFSDLWEYMCSASIVLNPHYYSIQEQVRISEALSNGKIILSEKSNNNIYDDLIVEFSNKTDLQQKIDRILSGNHTICEKDLILAYKKKYGSSNIQ